MASANHAPGSMKKNSCYGAMDRDGEVVQEPSGVSALTATGKSGRIGRSLTVK